ncbi:acyltransferase [Vibrio panuliri]|uniref:Acyltransferase n=1 Tax=Vibrio panuliri TaxID=1381081 RepID=A0A1Q9HL22_9VIBR|nr:acyltransferase [Vibrio panuliri]OLQ91123.1 acyltransferase [Vibrio panuliri]
MLAYLLFFINASLVFINSALMSLIICLLALFKLILPIKIFRHWITYSANKIMWLWATINGVILRVTNNVEWDIKGVEGLSQDGWYLLISNHRSWTDIVVLCCVFKDSIPMPKFFLKQQLLYVPFIGMACWALDMPFMRRYSREYLLRNPEKRGQDLHTTRRSCAKFKHTPTTVVNYVEGTRFTAEKHAKSKAGYQYLLQPKSGGIAYTLAAMGEQFDHIIDVTIGYPDNRIQPFKDLLMGKMKRIVVDVELLPVDERITGDYFNDKKYKRQFQLWLDDVWRGKDAKLDKIYQPLPHQSETEMTSTQSNHTL